MHVPIQQSAATIRLVELKSDVPGILEPKCRIDIDTQLPHLTSQLYDAVENIETKNCRPDARVDF